MITSILNELKENKSSLYKQEIIKKHSDNEIFLKYLNYALNPNYIYYIKKIPDYESNITEKHNWHQSLELLHPLLNRELTGHAAISHLTYILENALEPKMIEYIIQKDIKSGINAKGINKVIKNHLPETPYMRCDIFNVKNYKKITFKAYSQTKMDGQYCNVIVKNNTVSFISRSGKPYEFFGALEEEFLTIVNSLKLKTKDLVFNGELLMLDNDGNVLPRETSNGLIQKYGKGTGDKELSNNIVIYIWDIIPYESYIKQYDKTPYERRFNILQKIKSNKIRLVNSVEVHSLEDIIKHYKENTSSGEEGTVIKLLDAEWKHGTSRKQFKVKPEIEVDMKIIGFKEGNGKHQGSLGSVLVESEDKKVVVSISGWKELYNDSYDERLVRDYIWNHQEELLNKIIAVKCSYLIENKKSDIKSLYLPRVIEFRDDKLTADTLDRIEEMDQMKILLNKFKSIS